MDKESCLRNTSIHRYIRVEVRQIWRYDSINAVSQDSEWIQGFPWMKDKPSTFPAHTVQDISLNAQEKQHLKKESRDEIRKEGITLLHENFAFFLFKKLHFAAF